jgi:hypothetical protein
MQIVSVKPTMFGQYTAKTLKGKEIEKGFGIKEIKSVDIFSTMVYNLKFLRYY